MAEVKISWEEVLKIIGTKYQIDNIKAMVSGNGESDMEVCQSISYLIGKYKNDRTDYSDPIQ
jgi:phosphoheptose isomerase